MTEKQELAAQAMTAALQGEKTAVLELQHAMIGEEIKQRELIKERTIAGIKADEATITNELLQVTPAHEGAHDDPEARKQRVALESQELQLHREERAEERAAWADEQPLTREDREIHKTTLEQEQRRKRIDERSISYGSSTKPLTLSANAKSRSTSRARREKARACRGR